MERAILNLDTSGTGLIGPLTDCLRDLSGNRTAVLFSGGLDSSIIAHLAKPFTELRLYTVGYPGSHDLEAGRKGAEEMGLPWEAVMVDDDALRSAIVYLRDLLEVSDPVTISFEVPLYLACARVPEAIMLSGQGADELFGGYARYSSMSPADLGEARRKDLQELLTGGQPREARLANMFGKELKCPYLDLRVIEAALAISPDSLMGDLGNKQPLRRIALDLGLSSAHSPKKAAQYGSGVMKAMKRIAASEGKDLKRWVAEVGR